MLLAAMAVVLYTISKSDLEECGVDVESRINDIRAKMVTDG